MAITDPCSRCDSARQETPRKPICEGCLDYLSGNVKPFRDALAVNTALNTAAMEALRELARLDKARIKARQKYDDQPDKWRNGKGLWVFEKAEGYTPEAKQAAWDKVREVVKDV